MNPNDLIKVAREGQVIAEVTYAEVRDGISTGRFLPTDHYYDSPSTSWKLLSEIAVAIPTKAPIAFPVGLVTAVFVIVSLATVLAISSGSKPVSAAQSAVVAKHDNLAKERADALASLEIANKNLERLLPKFEAKEDKFNSLTWYTHLNESSLFESLYSSPPAALLTVNVNSRGGRYMTVYSFGKSSFLFEYATFLIEGKKRSTRNATSDDYKVLSGNVLNWCNYMDEEDRELCGAIAKAVELGHPIMCRISGYRDRVLDWELTPEERRVFSESVALADALKQQAVAEAALKRLGGR